ncbi:hypothetical protein [Streptomyces sp. S1D4-14]|uniref:hypothetical protein n=1 Tax=Streptomyces sp. S1D4-14 TaxID=2594461 RepID=UPI0011641A04|nr:hypothetical protein [Streptomyces sp. S1D4-14]QDN64488.1 hypothetical protein FNV66_01245 [Streptomyces sp. S1D4-14]
MNDFRTGRSLTRAGHTWYCQTPGIRWETAPDGWQLFLTDGPSWHLMGLGEHIGVEESLCTTRLKQAMDEAAEEIAKRAARATA